MTTPAHLFGGYLALRASKKIWAQSSLSERQSHALFIFGLLFSIAIDLDVLVTGGIAGHHQQLTHYPLFWLAITSLIFSIGRLGGVEAESRQTFLKSLALVILISSWTHMALDLFGVTMGIHWFWPFSNYEFSITPLKTTGFASEADRWQHILRSPVTLIGDATVILVGLIVLVKNVKKARSTH